MKIKKLLYYNIVNYINYIFGNIFFLFCFLKFPPLMNLFFVLAQLNLKEENILQDIFCIILRPLIIFYKRNIKY